MKHNKLIFVGSILLLSFCLAGAALSAARAAQSAVKAARLENIPETQPTTITLPNLPESQDPPASRSFDYHRFSPAGRPSGNQNVFSDHQPDTGSAPVIRLGGAQSELFFSLAADSNPPLPSEAEGVVCMSTQRVWGLVNPSETVTVTINGSQMGASLANHRGYFWTTLYDNNGNRPLLNEGDQITIFHNGNQKANLTLKSITGKIDQYHEIVSGTISGVSSPISVTIYAPISEPSLTSYSQTVSTDASGYFEADFSGILDLITWDEAIVAYSDNDIEVHQHVYALPGMLVRPKPYNWVMGMTDPGSLVTVTVYLADQSTIKDSATVEGTPPGGFFFSAMLTDIVESDVVYVQFENGQVMSRTVDTLSLYIDAENDRITGEAEPGATVRTQLDDLTPSGWKTHTASATVGSSGTYTLELSGSVDIMPGQTAAVFVADDEGDELNPRSFAPAIEVDQTWNEVYGRGIIQPDIDLAGQPVTLTIFNAASESVSEYTTQMSWNGYFEFTGKEFEMPDIAPGDLVTVNIEVNAWQGVVPVKTITVEHDLDNDRFTGSVESPSDRVELSGGYWMSKLYPQAGSFDLVTTASSPFTATPLGFDVDFNVGYNVNHRTADGFIDRIYRETGGFGVFINGNAVVANLAPAGSAYTITLFDSGYTPKAQLTGFSNEPSGDIGWQDFNSSGEQIHPGDWVQVQSSAGYSQSMQIPNLTLNADPETDVIFGQGPENSLILINSDPDGDGYVPTDAEGNFKVTLSELQELWGDADLQFKDTIWAQYNDPNRNWVFYDILWSRMRVNYGHDWVGGDYEAGHTFWITVTDNIGEVKGNATVESDYGKGWGGPGFETRGEDWTSGTPDIQSGDLIYLLGDDSYTNVITVGVINAVLDLDNNLVSGTIEANWFTQTLFVRCEIWVENGPDGVETTAEPDGGSYQCDFSGIWDLQAGEDVAVRYEEPDGDMVINVFREVVPSMRVNYSHDWVGGDYEAGHTFWITVTDNDGAVKGKATLASTSDRGWGGSGFETQWEDWLLHPPDIQVDDWVYFRADDGYTNLIHVGSISEEVDFDANTVSGTVNANWFTETLGIRCEVWVDNGPDGIDTTASADGGNYTCDFTEMWNVLPGQDVMARYIEPDGDSVINVYPMSRPHVGIQKWADGYPAAGNNMVFKIRYYNNGNASADDVVITDTLEGMSYISDSTGFSVVTETIPGGERLVLDLGSIPPSSSRMFLLYARINATETERVTNTVRIATSNPYNASDSSELMSEWSGEVIVNDTHLNIGKGAWTGNPAPGYDFVYSVNACNSGSTNSANIVITDSLPLSTTLVSWWGQHPGWTEVLSSTHKLVLSLPSLGGYQCSEAYILANLSSAAWGGMQITNIASLYSANDLEIDDNQASIDLMLGTPRDYMSQDLALNKEWYSGQLVPGGEMYYQFTYRNQGNIPADGVKITSTLPVSTAFLESYYEDEYGRQPVTPSLVTDNYVVWDIGTLGEGIWRRINVHLKIDWLASPGIILTHRVWTNILPNEYDTADNQIEWMDPLNDYGPNLRVDKQTYRWNGKGQLENEIHLFNLGSQPLEAFWITDTYPLSTSLSNWWVGHGVNVTFTHNVSQRQLIWWVERMYPGDNANLIYQVDVDGGDTQPGMKFTNQVEVPIEGDIDSSDNSDQLTISSGTDVFVEKWISSGEIEPGQLVTFTIKFGNHARSPWDTDTSLGSRLTDTLPLEMAYVRASAPWDWDETWNPSISEQNELEWGWGPMWADSTWYFELVAQISSTVQGGETFTNTIEAYSENPDEFDMNWEDNIDRVPMLVVNPNFQVSKVYESSQIAGMPVTYTLTVTNSGNEDASNIELIDWTPGWMTYGGGGSYSSGKVTWYLSSLAKSGGFDTRQFYGTLACTAGGLVENQNYRVASSDQGAFSLDGPPVNFTILAPNITAGFEQSDTDIKAGETVYFTSTSFTDGSTLAFDWDFGDGFIGSGANASHLYSEPGRRTVNLTVTDGCGYSDTITSTVVVKTYLYLPILMKNYGSP